MVPALLLLFPAGLVVPLLFVAGFPPLPGAAWELCTACALIPQHLKAICSPIKALVVYNYATEHHRKRTWKLESDRLPGSCQCYALQMDGYGTVWMGTKFTKIIVTFVDGKQPIFWSGWWFWQPTRQNGKVHSNNKKVSGYWSEMPDDIWWFVLLCAFHRCSRKRINFSSFRFAWKSALLTWQLWDSHLTLSPYFNNRYGCPYGQIRQ